jgi:CrcB protein
MNAWTIVATAIAGGIGAGLRYLVDAGVMRRRHGRFPLGILIVNVSGSFALGILVGLGGTLGSQLLTILGTGMLGGYTTFSTVSVESALLFQRRSRRSAWVNLFGTLGVALAAAGVGLLAGGALGGIAGG